MQPTPSGVPKRLGWREGRRGQRRQAVPAARQLQIAWGTPIAGRGRGLDS